MNMRPQPHHHLRFAPVALRATAVPGARLRGLLADGARSTVTAGALALAACSSAGAPSTSPAVPAGASGLRAPGETHFSELVQLTDGGENAEAYWSSSGQQLIFQAHAG
jgi:hypothetical protein